MRRRLVWAFVLVIVLVAGAAWYTRGMGFTSRTAPRPLEETTMRAARRWATPPEIRARTNPVEPTPSSLRSGLEHWADHCAVCHGNDGSGDTPIGRSLFPPAPDMRGPQTQGMTDGELFYVIERGIPFTGMPAWSTGTEAGERASWELVLFVRHLPKLTDEERREMETLNPKSAAEIRRQEAIDDFLSGGKKGGR